MEYYNRWKKMSRSEQFCVLIMMTAACVGFMFIATVLMALGQYIGLDNIAGLVLNHVGAGIVIVSGLLVSAGFPVFLWAQYQRH